MGFGLSVTDRLDILESIKNWLHMIAFGLFTGFVVNEQNITLSFIVVFFMSPGFCVYSEV